MMVVQVFHCVFVVGVGGDWTFGASEKQQTSESSANLRDFSAVALASAFSANNRFLFSACVSASFA